jgi:Tfp pilus assembly protein PilF
LSSPGSPEGGGVHRGSGMSRMILVFLSTWILLSGCTAQRQPSLDDEVRARELIDQGVLELRAGGLEQARASFELAYELAPSAAALDGMGCAAMLQGDVAGAEKLLLSAYEFDQEYTNSLGNLALLYEIQGMREEARRLYERAVQENPKNFRFRNNFAAFLIEYGSEASDRARAREQLQKARAMAPHPLVGENLEQFGGQHE